MIRSTKPGPMESHFHRHGDGRGQRRVMVNGNPVDWALWADTRRGPVCYAPQLVKVKRNSDEIYTRMLRGQVTVEYI